MTQTAGERGEPRWPMPGGGARMRRAWALAFVAACASTVAATLAAQSARVLVRLPLVERPARGPLVAVPMAVFPAESEGTRHRVALRAGAAAQLVVHDELWLFVSRSGGARIASATLTMPGGCRFEAKDPGDLPEGDPLVLRRGGHCAPPAVGAQQLALEVTTAAPAALALWAHLPRGDSAARGRITVQREGEPVELSVRGFRVDHPATAPRVELLSAMWRRAGRPGWLWLLLGLATALAGAGVLVIPTRRPPSAPASERRHAARCGAGAALLAASLALFHVVATPPLCGPDEPYHLMGFGELVGDASLVEDTLQWMAETHQMRIRHHPDERFRTIDVGVPEEARDPEARPTEVAMRSPTLAVLWRAYGPALAGRAAPDALLRLRLANSMLFAAAVGGAAALATFVAAAAYPQWIVVGLLFVPSLPFFAMHVSETAVLCSIYVLLAACLAALFLDGPRVHFVGLPLGLACGLMLAGGRSPWPLAAMVGAALAGRVLLGQRGAERPGPARAVFWLGFSLGLSTFHLVLNDEFVRSVVTLSASAPAVLHGLVKLLLGSALLPAALGAAGAGLETALAALTRPLQARLAAPARALARWCGPALAAAVALSLLASLVVALPHLELEPRQPLTLAERLHDALWTTATLFRLRDPNFLLATSFWVGFGWLDAIPGPFFQGVLVLLAAVPTMVLLDSLGRPSQPRRLLWLALLGAGAFVSMALYTVITQGQMMALHGRYLIGWYLTLVALAACGLALAERAGRWLPPVLLVSIGVVHVYSLCFVLQRYF